MQLLRPLSVRFHGYNKQVSRSRCIGTALRYMHLQRAENREPTAIPVRED